MTDTQSKDLSRSEKTIIPSATCLMAGIASFFFPGLGQLLLGKLGAAAAFFVVEMILWLEYLSGFSYIGLSPEITFFMIFGLRVVSAYLISNVEKQSVDDSANEQSAKKRQSYEEYLEVCSMHNIKPRSRREYED